MNASATDIVSFDTLCQRWRKVVGPSIAALTWPCALVHDGTLYISVASPQGHGQADLAAIATAILASVPSEIAGTRIRRVRWMCRAAPPYSTRG